MWAAAAVGGPTQAEVEATGSVDGLLSLGAWLGYRLEVVTADGLAVWWGQVDGVTVAAGGLEREIGLDGMANRVKVLYSEQLPGGELAGTETGWLEDRASVGRYGRRELVYSAPSSLTVGQATALRDRVLAAGKDPQRRLWVGSGGTGKMRMRCRGWWQRLGDVYYAQAAGIEQHTPGNGTAIPVGLGLASAFVGFGGSDGARRIHQVYGGFGQWHYPGLKVRVSGTGSNDGVRTVVSASRQAAVSYTASTIAFDSSDDIRDGAAGLGSFGVGDVIWISGAAAPGNNGAKLVKTAGVFSLEVSPGWSGGTITNGAAGPAVTILRGNSVAVEEATPNERPDGSTVETVTAWGQRVYQQFSITTALGWTLNAVELRVRRVGNPADALRVGLYVDGGGTPAATAIEAVTGAALPTAVGWVSFGFSNSAPLQFGTLYGLVVERTGAMDSENFYEVEIDEAGEYPRGWMLLHDGVYWQEAAGSVIFRCLGAQDTAWQVREVVTGAGVWLDAAVVAESGVMTVQFQAGDETALAIVENLLAQGTSEGKRLLAAVTAEGSVRVWVREAGETVERLLVWRGGGVAQGQGEATVEGWLPAGRWVFVDDVLLSGAWVGLSPVFVEEATYSVGQGLRLGTENQRAVAGLFGTRQG
jgi:hypothetical protein